MSNFFDPPALVATEIFATLPDELRNVEANPELTSGQPVGTPNDSLLEGPSFDRDGNLYCVDLPAGRVLKLSIGGEFSVIAEYDGWPNGLKIHKDGRIFIADYKNGIMELDPVNGKISPYLVRAGLEHFKAVNDLFFAANGDLYFTDQGLTGYHDPSGRLFRLRPTGHIDCLLDNVPSPNGLVMNLEENVIYLAVTRANAVWRVPLKADGGVTKVGTFVQLSGGNGPDGLALDENGGLVIAHFGLGCAWVTNFLGEPLFRVQSCAGLHTTNVLFGGPDNKNLYITEAGSAQIIMARMETPGKAMFSHQ